MQTEAITLPRRSEACAITDRRIAPDAANHDGVVNTDPQLTFGMRIELLNDARVLTFSPGHGANRFDLALLEAIEDRIGNPWA